MNGQDIALIVAGIIGAGVAIMHGVLTQRLMVRPIEASFADKPAGHAVRRLVPILLQFSTYNWFLGGLALILAATWVEQDVRVAICVLVASSYLFGAIGNLWGTRGRHPGWMLYAFALVLIAYGAVSPSA